MGIRPTVALWHTARTGAIGQERPVSFVQPWTFKRPLHSETCQIVPLLNFEWVNRTSRRVSQKLKGLGQAKPCGACSRARPAARTSPPWGGVRGGDKMLPARAGGDNQRRWHPLVFQKSLKLAPICRSSVAPLRRSMTWLASGQSRLAIAEEISLKRLMAR